MDSQASWGQGAGKTGRTGKLTTELERAAIKAILRLNEPLAGSFSPRSTAHVGARLPRVRLRANLDDNKMVIMMMRPAYGGARIAVVSVIKSCLFTQSREAKCLRLF